MLRPYRGKDSQREAFPCGWRDAAHCAGLKESFLKQIAILGSTGSIGRQCISVVEALPGRFGVVALAAGSNLDELVGEIERDRPEVVSVGGAGKGHGLAPRL